jgi:DNA invertase Pin-like site-specific DNA recombinase
MLGAIATFENDLRKDRQSQGVDLAVRKGIKFGRKPSLNNEQINAMRQKRSEGIKIADLMGEFKVSKASVYRCLSSVSC